MPKRISPAVPSDIVDSGPSLSVDELCRACQVEVEWIAELAEHAVVEPKGQSKSEWTFSSLSVIRVAKAKRLQRDLGLNVPGIALAFDLLNEIERLNEQLAALREAT